MLCFLKADVDWFTLLVICPGVVAILASKPELKRARQLLYH